MPFPSFVRSRPSAVATHARRSFAIAAALVAASLVTWLVLVARMRDMDMGPGTDLGGLGWYLGIWVTMTAAMMLPSAAPVVLLFARIERNRSRPERVPIFVAGYLLAWTAYGLAAYALFRGLHAAWPASLSWERHGPLVAGAAVCAAGLYQLTPLNRACLRHCRSPLHF